MEIIISNKIKIKDPHPVIKEILLEQLKHNNPKYVDAEKMGKSTYKIDEFLCNYEFDEDSSMYIPRGMRGPLLEHLNALGLPTQISDERAMNFIGYLDGSKINYRKYQQPAIEKLLHEGPEGVLVAPPGSGKTVMGLSLIPVLLQNTLWLTHTDRLFKQTYERCLEFLPGLKEDDIGMIGGGKWKIGKVLTIGMIPTLVRNIEKLSELKNHFGLVVLDECLIAGTKITMLDGTSCNIENVKNGDVTTFGKVTNKFERKTDSLVKLRCSIEELVGTPTHQLPFISRNKVSINKHTNSWEPFNEKDVTFEEIKNINKNDYLLVKEDAPHTERFNIGKRKARLLSLIACDGHIEKNLRCLQVGITKDKDWFLSEMWQNTLIYNDHNIHFSDCARGDLIIRSYSKKSIADMHRYIPKGNKSKNIRVPHIIMNGSYEDIINYLQVAFDCEGSVTDQITITMAGKDFIKDIQSLLRKFGIIGRLIPIPSKDHLRLAMTGYDAFLFWKKIGFSMPRKQQKLKELLNKASKYRKIIKFRGISYRCVRVLNKEIINKSTTVYDFTTEQHLFIANGILSSNCHHCPASTFLSVISQLNPYFLYGLTATAYRRDKLESMMFQCLGPIRSKITKDTVAAHKGIISPKIIYTAIKHLHKVDGNDIPTIFKNHIIYNHKRNAQIVKDVVREAKLGNFCIIASGRKVHCDLLHEMIKKEWSRTGVATGNYSKKIIDGQIEAFNNNEITVLITTSELLGEGFDVDFLNRLFITTPFRTEARVEQLVGRIQRFHKDKKDAIVYDYVDEGIGVLVNQFYSKYGECRSKVYKRLGLEMLSYDQHVL